MLDALGASGLDALVAALSDADCVALAKTRSDAARLLPPTRWTRCSFDAFASSSLQRAQWVAGDRIDPEWAAVAAARGDCDMLAWLFERLGPTRFVPAAEQALLLAAGHGHVDATAWLLRRVAPTTELLRRMAWDAVRADRARWLEWMLRHERAGSLKDDCDRLLFVAAQSGSLETLNVLAAFAPIEPTLYNAAAHNNQLRTIRWLQNRGCEADDGAIVFAALGGHVELLRWLYDHEFPRNPQAAAAHAVESGRVEVVQWLLARHPECDVAALGAFARAKGWHAMSACLDAHDGRESATDGREEESERAAR